MSKMSTKVIEEVEVKVLKRKLRKRISLQVKVGSIIGKTLGDLSEIVKKVQAEGVENLDMVEVALPIIGELFSTLNDNEVQELIDNLLAGVYVGDADVSDEDVFESVFGDDQMLLFKVLGYSAEVNLGGFLSQMGISFGSLKKQETPEQ